MDSASVRFILEQSQLERIRHDLDDIEVDAADMLKITTKATSLSWETEKAA
jgi:hypothetical protein